MSDDFDDFFGIDDDAPVRADAPLGLVVPAAIEHLEKIEAAMRSDPDYSSAALVIFNGEDNSFENVAEFRNAMKLSRDPTLAEATDWHTAKRAAVSSRCWNE